VFEKVGDFCGIRNPCKQIVEKEPRRKNSSIILQKRGPAKLSQNTKAKKKKLKNRV
jgi:hypothetical protein